MRLRFLCQTQRFCLGLVFALGSQALVLAVGRTQTPLPLATAPNLSSGNQPASLPVPPAPGQPDYFLGAGDVVDIKVFDYPEYTSSQVILPDGSISLPLIGNVSAADRTTLQLAQAVTERLQALLVKPSVSITINKLRPIRINVAGEVQRPGPIQLQSLAPTLTTSSSNPLRVPTLTEALLEAGGVTRNADIRRVMLARYHPTRAKSPIAIDLWAMLHSHPGTGDVLLQDGDTIVVPKLESQTSLDQRLAARASFAPKTVRVRVMGEVKQPGEVAVSPDSTLISALAIAGGATDKANLHQVAFVRMNERGQIERQEIDLKDFKDSIQVQDGDILVVPKSSGSKFLDVATQLVTPLGFFLNLFR